MDYEPLHIRDSEQSTDGGPPGWLACISIFSVVGLIAVLAFLAGLVV